MANLSRRTFLLSTAAVSVASATKAFAASGLESLQGSKRILVGSGTPDGILSFAWDETNGTLHAEGIAAGVSHSTWLELSPDRKYLYVACELEEFEGKPTGAVASYGVADGKLTAISDVSSTGRGTCHLTTDQTGRVVICANYTGGSAASFVATDGKLSEPVWKEQYKGYAGHGPVADRQEKAHAHFASVSPDNRYVYINDLGADKIHIYKLDDKGGKLTAAGTYRAKPGVGPRTLHFSVGQVPSAGKVAYCMNELNSTVVVLEWNSEHGSLHPMQTLSVLTGEKPAVGVTNSGCDTVLSRDGKFAYFANRGTDFILGCSIDGATGKLTPLPGNPRTTSGGKTPRNFRLDPTERWMLVANQQSSNISVFARDPKTGAIAPEGRSFPAATPMCIVFL